MLNIQVLFATSSDTPIIFRNSHIPTPEALKWPPSAGTSALLGPVEKSSELGASG